MESWVLWIKALHVLAVKLPEHFSAHGARQASAMEQKANAFSNFWLTNALWFPGVVAGACFILASALWWQAVSTGSAPDRQTNSGRRQVQPAAGRVALIERFQETRDCRSTSLERSDIEARR